MSYQLTEHFFADEFFCPCGCGANHKAMDPLLIEKLEAARQVAGVAISISSSIR